jgi:hypothetical protein
VMLVPSMRNPAEDVEVHCLGPEPIQVSS